MATRAYWRQFAASVTGFAHRYRRDPLARTKASVIALQALLAAAILALSLGLSDAHIPAQRVALVALVATALFSYFVAKIALTPADQALTKQKQFVGNIAHELRTPLAIIKANTEVRLLDADVPSSARTVHESNLEELDRISDIIDNLLSLNALLAPEPLRFSNVDVGTIAHRVVKKLSNLTSRKPVRVKVKIARERLAWGNPSAIEQILTNIVRNAITHSSAGEIIISIVTSANPNRFVRISVHDSGAGMKQKDLFRAFEPFYRGAGRRANSGGAGSGLGLAIVSELVKLHRGSIRIRSAPGRGTTVIVALPAGTYERKSQDDEMHEVSEDFSSAPYF